MLSPETNPSFQSLTSLLLPGYEALSSVVRQLYDQQLGLLPAVHPQPVHCTGHHPLRRLLLLLLPIPLRADGTARHAHRTGTLWLHSSWQICFLSGGENDVAQLISVTSNHLECCEVREFSTYTTAVLI